MLETLRIQIALQPSDSITWDKPHCFLGISGHKRNIKVNYILKILRGQFCLDFFPSYTDCSNICCFKTIVHPPQIKVRTGLGG